RFRHVARWTIMFYLDGDDSTLGSSISNQFKEIVSVGSSCDLNLIAQYDRYGRNRSQDPDDPHWTETLRFHVTKDMPATRRYAYAILGEKNMADGCPLADFVRDTQRRFPAEHYALIISGHGFGYQLQVAQLLKAHRIAAVDALSTAGSGGHR